MVIRQWIKIVGLVVLSALLVSLPLQTQTNTPAIDLYASELLQKMGEALQAAQDFMFKAETTVDAVSETGQKIATC